MTSGQPFDSAQRKLIDEIEQLRTLLESALDENARLVAERDQLRLRVEQVSGELRTTSVALSLEEGANATVRKADARQTETEEELRVAFEELQVLTEELEVANTSLHQTNLELDARVDERTRQLREMNALLRSAEASFSTVVDLVPDLLWRADGSGSASWFNQRWFAFTGQSAHEPLGMGWLKVVHPLDRTASRASWDIAIASGNAYQRQHRIRSADGSYRWFLVRAEPLRDERGRIVNWFATGTDIDDQRTAMEALQHSERRFRILIEGMPQLVWRAADGGKWTWSSPQWRDYTGQSEQDSLGSGWLDAILPEDREAARAAWDNAYKRDVLEFEARILHHAEHRHRHFRTRALPVHDQNGEILEWLGTSTDVDDLLQLQEQQEVLVQELQHRTRNLMAVVHAVTMRTIKESPTLDKFKACIDDRLQALARVQGLLARRGRGMRVPFDLLLREELSAHVTLDEGGRGDQVDISGPRDVSLRSATVQTLALAVHELATNAVKYGALSGSVGRLTITWDVRIDDDGIRHLLVDWRESGVEMPGSDVPPRGSGYGRELIERALPYQLGAKTSYMFEADGVHCTIEMALPPNDASLEKDDD